MRTEYTRVTNPKSGKGTKDIPLGDRDQWILNTFLQTTKERAASLPREVEYFLPESDSESDEHDEQEDDMKTRSPKQQMKPQQSTKLTPRTSRYQPLARAKARSRGKVQPSKCHLRMLWKGNCWKRYAVCCIMIYISRKILKTFILLHDSVYFTVIYG